MTNLSNDELRALLAAASPEPWDVYLWHQADKIEIWDITADTTTVAECQWCHDDAVAAEVVRANARLIALAPALAAEVIRLREALQGMLETSNGFDFDQLCKRYDATVVNRIMRARAAMGVDND